jgi:hypothetical protein
VLSRSFPEAVAAALPEKAHGKPLEVWFRGTRRGSASRAPSPASGRSVALARGRRATRATSGPAFSARSVPSVAAAGLVMPFADTGAMNHHLAEISRTVAPGAHAVLVLDGAGWHGGHALVVPCNVSLVVLPPLSL